MVRGFATDEKCFVQKDEPSDFILGEVWCLSQTVAVLQKITPEDDTWVHGQQGLHKMST